MFVNSGSLPQTCFRRFPSLPELRCIDVWIRPTLESDSWIDVSFRYACTWVRESWSKQESIWQSQLQDSTSPRQPDAERLGLKTGLFCPLTIGTDSLGILVLFCKRSLQRDEELLQMMTTASNQIGQFFNAN